MNFQKSQLKDVVGITHHSLSKPLQVTQTGQKLKDCNISSLWNGNICLLNIFGLHCALIIFIYSDWRVATVLQTKNRNLPIQAIATLLGHTYDMAPRLKSPFTTSKSLPLHFRDNQSFSSITHNN